MVAQAWLAEIGPAPHRHFATHEKLASWVTLCPGNNISARKRKHGRTGDAGTYIKPMLIQAAWAAIRVRGRLQARYNRLVRRFGGEKNPAAKKKAITAIAHTLLKIAYQVLKSGTPYQDLGADFYTRRESPAAEAGLPGTPAAKAPPRLHHHHHHQPPGGRLTTRRLTRSPDPASPGAAADPGTPALPPDNQRHSQPSPPPRPGFAAARPPRTQFSCQWGLFSRLPLTFVACGWRRCLPCRVAAFGVLLVAFCVPGVVSGHAAAACGAVVGWCVVRAWRWLPR